MALRPGRLRKFGPACIRHWPWQSRWGATTRCAYPLRIDGQCPNSGARSGVSAVGPGDAGPRAGDRRCRPADRGRMEQPAAATGGRASTPRFWSTSTSCGTCTTPRNITILQTSSTTIPKLAGIFASMSTWMLGYPDRALRINEKKDAHARRRGHPFDLGYGLTTGAHEFDQRCTPDDLHKRAEECERLGRENSLPVLWAMLAPVSYGLALIREGKTAEANCPTQGRHRVLGGERRQGPKPDHERIPGRSYGADRRP